MISNSVYYAKDETDVQIPTSRKFLNLPVVSKTILQYKCHFNLSVMSKTILKNNFQPGCDTKTIIKSKCHTQEYLNLPMMPKTILDYKILNQEELNSERLYPPLMPNTKLNCKCQTQDDFYPCL